jgi:hypothetical protein
MEKLRFETLADGGALERVNDAIDQAVENIADVNTEPEVKRQVVVTITLKPDSKRSYATVDVTAKLKLAPASGVGAAVFLVQTKDGLQAVENLQKQPDLPGLEGLRHGPPAPSGPVGVVKGG